MLKLRYEDIALGSPFHVARIQSSSLSISSPFHCHDFTEVFLVTEGKIRHQIGTEQEICEAGSLRWINPEDSHRFLPTKEGGVFINVAFPTTTKNELLKLMKVMMLSKSLELSEKDFQDSRSLFVQLHRSGIEKPDQASLISFLAHCVQTLSRSDINVASSDFVDNMIDRLGNHEFAAEGLPALLRTSNYSLPHLCRMVKSKTGLTPTELVNEHRIRHARRLLATSFSPIEQIAFEVGFENPSYFFRIFRKKCGVTPGHFRQSQLRFLGSRKV